MNYYQSNCCNRQIKYITGFTRYDKAIIFIHPSAIDNVTFIFLHQIIIATMSITLATLYTPFSPEHAVQHSLSQVSQPYVPQSVKDYHSCGFARLHNQHKFSCDTQRIRRCRFARLHIQCTNFCCN